LFVSHINGRTQGEGGREIRCWEMYWERRGEDVKGGWRKLHNDEICDNFYPTPNIITLIKTSRMNGPGMWHARESRDVHRVLLRLLLRRRYEGDTKLGLTTVERERVDLFCTVHGQVGGWCEHGMNLWIP